MLDAFLKSLSSLVLVAAVGSAQNIPASTSPQDAVATSTSPTVQTISAHVHQEITDLQRQIRILKQYQQSARSLKQGDSGDDVEIIQRLLTVHGFQVAATSTGFYGPATKKAVMSFQNQHSINPTGIVDSETRAALFNYVVNSDTATTTDEVLSSDQDLQDYAASQVDDTASSSDTTSQPAIIDIRDPVDTSQSPCIKDLSQPDPLAPPPPPPTSQPANAPTPLVPTNGSSRSSQSGSSSQGNPVVVTPSNRAVVVQPAAARPPTASRVSGRK